MNLIRAIYLFAVATALLCFCAVLAVVADGAAEIVFSNIALTGAVTLIGMAWEPLVDEVSTVVDVTIPQTLTRARSSRRRWLRALAGGSTALSYGA